MPSSSGWKFQALSVYEVRLPTPNSGSGDSVRGGSAPRANAAARHSARHAIERIFIVRLSVREIETEGLREEHRHLSARQRRVRTEVPVAAAARDAGAVERLDELVEGMRRGDVVDALGTA